MADKEFGAVNGYHKDSMKKYTLHILKTFRFCFFFFLNHKSANSYENHSHLTISMSITVST